VTLFLSQLKPSLARRGLQDLGHGLPKHVQVERLGDEGARVHRQRLPAEFLRGLAGHEDAWDGGLERVPEQADGLQTRQARHLHVHEGHVDGVPAHHLHGPHARPGQVGPVALGFEDLAEAVEADLIVVGDQKRIRVVRERDHERLPLRAMQRVSAGGRTVPTGSFRRAHANFVPHASGVFPPGRPAARLPGLSSGTMGVTRVVPEG